MVRVGVVLGLGLLLFAAMAWAMVQTHPRHLPRENSPDVCFARDMMAHHAQAVEMALIMRERSTSKALRTFMLDIALTQQAQIGQMQGWLAVWGLPQAGLEAPMQGMQAQMGMAAQPQIEELRRLPISQAEIQFLRLMIRHHQGGVMMAQTLLNQSSRPEVVSLAQSIVQGQNNEIEWMNNLLSERNAPLPQPLKPMDHPVRR